jgi:hypothetical protein
MQANTEIRISYGYGKKGGPNEVASSRHQGIPQERIDTRIFFAVIA